MDKKRREIPKARRPTKRVKEMSPQAKEMVSEMLRPALASIAMKEAIWQSIVPTSQKTSPIPKRGQRVPRERKERWRKERKVKKGARAVQRVLKENVPLPLSPSLNPKLAVNGRNRISRTEDAFQSLNK